MPYTTDTAAWKPKERQLKRITTLVLAFVITVSLVACCGGGGGSSPTGDESANQNAGVVAEASGELAGKPWVTSIAQGNLPAEQPEAKDDLYTHYAYDYLAAHQEQSGSQSDDYVTEFKSANLAVIKDGSKTSHDLEQLRIFFNQAADFEKLKETGLSEVQPYLDRIAAVSSIEEMNKLLLAEDFPFSPFILPALSLSDTREVNIVSVNPNLVLCDPLLVGGAYYQDSDDPQKQESIDRTLLIMGSDALVGLSAQGMSSEDVMAAYKKFGISRSRMRNTWIITASTRHRHLALRPTALLWFSIKPSTDNAFYDTTSNPISIYPGYVTSLVYSKEMSDTSILAGIGTTIGHEISHGFDYVGAQFDAYGVPNPMFADADANAFVKKSSELAAYYSGIEVLPGLMVDGDTVNTEAAADLCGMQLVLEIAGKSEGVDYDEFFATYSLMWAQTVPAESLLSLVLDAHPLNNIRTNVSAQMFGPIYEKLGVKEGDGMYLAPDKRINVWGLNA